MCCDDKCFFFIRVRTASLIFGYIAAVISAVAVLVCVGMIFGSVCYIFQHGPNDYVNATMILSLISFQWCTGGFTCTVLLLYGITNMKPVLVKTYTIFGMLQLVLLLIVMTLLFCFSTTFAGILVMSGCGIYLACLYMVYLTYKEMASTSGGNVFSNPPNLIMA